MASTLYIDTIDTIGHHLAPLLPQIDTFIFFIFILSKRLILYKKTLEKIEVTLYI